MPVRCLVLVKTTPSFTQRVWLSLRDMRVTESLYTISGRFDFLMVIESDSYDSCTKTVIEEIRLVAGVETSETLLILKEDWYVSSSNEKISAFILLKTVPAATERLYEELNGAGNITSIALITGSHDIIVRISASSVTEFAKRLMYIRTRQDVADSETFLISHYRFATGTVLLQKSMQ